MTFPHLPAFFSWRPGGTSDRPADRSTSPAASTASLPLRPAARPAAAGQLAPLLERRAPAATGNAFAAACGGDAKTLQALLVKDPGLLTRKFRNGDSLLTAAAADGHKQVVAVLLAHVATQPPDSQAEILNHRNDASDSALALAIKRYDEDLAELLLSQAGTDVNRPDAQGDMPLHLAILKTSKLSLRIIARPGTELDVPNHQQETPLAIALRKQWRLVVKALVESGRVDLGRADLAGRTPLWQMLVRAEETLRRNRLIYWGDWLNTLEALTAAPGFDPACPGPSGQTPLMFLRSLPDEEFSGAVMQILAEAGRPRGQAAQGPADPPGSPAPAADA
jgi:hypothetical protein